MPHRSLPLLLRTRPKPLLHGHTTGGSKDNDARPCGAVIEAAIAEQSIAAGMAVAGLIGVVTKDKTETKKEDSDNG